MKLTGPDKGELMTVSALERDGHDLMIKGKVFGTMPMTARLTPDQARAALKLVNFRTALFILTLPFRRG
jgi:hypothetical protein